MDWLPDLNSRDCSREAASDTGSHYSCMKSRRDCHRPADHLRDTENPVYEESTTAQKAIFYLFSVLFTTIPFAMAWLRSYNYRAYPKPFTLPYSLVLIAAFAFFYLSSFGGTRLYGWYWKALKTLFTHRFSLP